MSNVGSTDGRPAARRMGARVSLALSLSAALGVAGFLAAGAIAQSPTVIGCAASGRTIALCTTKIGSILVTSKGHTLYLFNKDRKGKSACYGSCAAFWPPLLRHGKPTLGPSVKRSLLGTTKRRNGTVQLTYNKHPLYTYTLDASAGQTKGEGSTAFGAKWYALSANGKAVVRTTTTTGTTKTTTTPRY